MYNINKMIIYGFMGALLGLFLVSIFKPVNRIIPELPTIETKKFYTKNGCVLIHADEVSCSSKAISLNLINAREDST
jgi:hypothetical protein